MEKLAKEFEGQAHFPFVYVREAHPGEVMPPHESWEQKVEHARIFRQYGNTRQILIDSLYGRVHRQYGGCSNMSYIIDHTGHVEFRATWTVYEDLKAVLDELLEMRARRQAGGFASTYYMEKRGMRLKPRLEKSLYHGGKQAEIDFKAALEKERKDDAFRGD